MASQRQPVWLSWSSGKDSAWALQELTNSSRYRVTGLFTTVNQEVDRVAMHGVRRILVEKQAASVRLPLTIIPLPWPCSNQKYDDIMKRFCERALSCGIKMLVFGDLHLEDVRAYREARLKGNGMELLFPLWGRPTKHLAQTMLTAGLRARIVCLDPNKLGPELAGCEFNTDFLEELSPTIDPCGENGEFHTFVYDGPMFHDAMKVRCSRYLERDGFIFVDLQNET